MSELNILNPTATDELNPDYGYTEGLPATIAKWQPRSGRPQSRRLNARGRVYDLVWSARTFAAAERLRRWEAQYEQDFFTYADYDRGRWFSGQFAGPLQYSPAGYNKVSIKGQFVELCGVPMYMYPNSAALWNRDSVFMAVRDSYGQDLVKRTGDPGYYVTLQAKSGFYYYTAFADASVEWAYFGYGFRVWAPKYADAGIMEVFWSGGLYSGTVNLDLYSAAILNSAPLQAIDLELGWHRVKLRCTGNKNPASSNVYAYMDTLEVMR